MRKIRVAQIGLGHPHSLGTADTLLRMGDVIDFIGYAEPSPDYCHPEHKNIRAGYEKRMKRYTVGQLLGMDDLDAVVIEVEEERATAYAQMFADKGVHIQMDKPGTHGYASFARLVETCRAKNLVFHMGYMYRYNAMVKKAMEMKRAGELGEIYAVEAHMSLCYGEDMASWISKHRGGMMYYLGCHDVDMVMQFMGGEPDEVIPFNCSTGQYGLNNENYGFAVLKYKNGVSFVKTSCAEHRGYDRRQLVICGSDATLEIKPIEMGAPNPSGVGLLLKAQAALARADKKEALESEPFDRYEGMLRAFVSYVRGEAENPYTYDYELALFRTVMKACGVGEEMEGLV